MEIREQADKLLDEMAVLKQGVEQSQSDAQMELDAVRAKHETKVAFWKGALLEKEKELHALMKGQVVPLFDGKDTVALEHGILLHTKDWKVSIPRDALQKIEGQDWTEAIKVVKSVDRAVVERWPEERLFMIGAKRELKEQFGYELLEAARLGG